MILIIMVLQGLLRMSKDYYKEPVKVVRLWVHECERVLADRMINDSDMTKFNEFRVNVTKKHFDDVNQVMPCKLMHGMLWMICIVAAACQCIRLHMGHTRTECVK